MLQFNFKLTHVAGSVKTAADFLCILELKVTEKVRLKIREDIQTTLIEVTTFSSDVADEQQFFFRQADNNNQTQQKEQSKQNAKLWVTNGEPPSLKTSVE